MRVIILTSWGGSFPVPILKTLLNDDRLEIIKIFSQGIHYKRLNKYHPSYYLNYKDNVAEMIKRSNYNDFSIIKSVNVNEIISFVKKNSVDYVFTIGYGEILKHDIISSPQKGVVNFHPGLLPENQGADPFASVLFNGFKETGVTFHFIDEGIDTGDVILKKRMRVKEEITYHALQLELGFFTSSCVSELLDILLSDKISVIKQKTEETKYFKKLKKEQGEFNFLMTSDEICRKINVYSDFPEQAYFLLNKFKISVRNCEKIMNAKGYKPSEIIDQGLGYLSVATKDNAVLLKGIKINELDYDLSNQLLNRIFNHSLKNINNV